MVNLQTIFSGLSSSRRIGSSIRGSTVSILPDESQNLHGKEDGDGNERKEKKSECVWLHSVLY